jgi:CBS domain containing-hemolysin-like protein
MSVLIAVVVLTVFISAQCSLFKAVLYSTRLGTLEAEKAAGSKQYKAKKFIEMKSRISIPLSAILILNTAAHTGGATIAGMYAHQILGASWLPLFSAVFTLLVLFFGEIIPKTIGAVHWRHLWHIIVLPISIIRYVLYPLIYISQKISDAVTPKNTASPVTEEDILGVIRLGAKGGEISQWESVMLHNIIQLETKEVEEIMTPRTVMFTLDETMTVSDAFDKAMEEGYSRIPIYREEKENIVGYVMLHDLSSAKILDKHDVKLSAIAKPVSFVTEKENCLSLLTEFLKKRRHIAIIGDEFGGVSGLVTLEDIIETMLGAEIVDEHDSVVDLQKLARKQRQKRFEVLKNPLPDKHYPDNIEINLEMMLEPEKTEPAPKTD